MAVIAAQIPGDDQARIGDFVLCAERCGWSAVRDPDAWFDPAAKALLEAVSVNMGIAHNARATSQTARRKAIYLELHPETAAGTAGADARWNATDNLSTASFAAETAKVSGKDERTVRRDAERGEKVIPEVIDTITGTKLDTGTYLDKLKRLPPNEQVAAAKRDLALLRSQKTARPASRYGPCYFGALSVISVLSGGRDYLGNATRQHCIIGLGRHLKNGMVEKPALNATIRMLDGG